MPLSEAEKAKICEELKPAFDHFDGDKSGFIDEKEFQKVVEEYNKTTKGKKIDAKQAAADFIALSDKNKDGKCSFDEFKKFIFEAIEALESA